jgi:hypothetical protein
MSERFKQRVDLNATRRFRALARPLRIATAVSFAFAASGACDMSQITESPNPTRIVLNSPSPLDTGIIKVEATPHPAGFFTEDNGRIGWYSENGDHLITPVIPGLTAEIQGENLIYVADTDPKNPNPYGLKADGKTEVARYKTDVMEKGKRVGAVMVDGRIADELMRTQSDAFPIPVNPDGQLGIIYYTQQLATTETQAIAFTYSGKTLFYNPFLNSKVYCSVQFHWNGREWSIFVPGETSTSGTNSVDFFGLYDTETKTDTVTTSGYAVGAPLIFVPGPMYAAAPTDLNRFNIVQVDDTYVGLGNYNQPSH